MNDNHPDYDEYLPYYLQVRTFIKGMDCKAYLQNVVRGTDSESTTRNKEYKARAKYTNFSGRTLNALQGAIYRKDPVIKLPKELEYLITNADGAGKSLTHVSKNTTSNLIQVGRHGIYTTYGESAKIVTYTAENIPNYEVDEAGILTKVVLITGKDETKHLIIDSEGFFAVEYYKDDSDVPYKTISPSKSDGTELDYIPFTFVGSIDNSPDTDSMPLWSIVDVSQGHYQNSAENEDIARFMVPTIAATVPNEHWQKEMLPNGYELGGGALIPLPENGQAMILQASPNQMHAEMMKDKENQLIMLGARLISGTAKSNQTAEAARIEFSAENSVLDNLVQNASEAIEKHLRICAEFMGVNVGEDDIEFNLNREYYDTAVNPQMIASEMLLLDRGIIAVPDVRSNLRKVGYLEADRTDEDIDGEIEVSGNGL